MFRLVNIFKMSLLFSMAILFLSFSMTEKIRASDVDLTGTWKGTWQSTLINQPEIVLVIEQDGKNFTGTIVELQGYKRTGKIENGKVKGNAFKFKIKLTNFGCKGTFKCVGNFEDSRGGVMDFIFKGKDCVGKHKNGSGYVIKQ